MDPGSMVACLLILISLVYCPIEPGGGGGFEAGKNRLKKKTDYILPQLEFVSRS